MLGTVLQREQAVGNAMSDLFGPGIDSGCVRLEVCTLAVLSILFFTFHVVSVWRKTALS